jgi:hypothetical protein
MFTVLFAIARTVGSIAQWKEMIEDRYNASAGRASSMPAQASGLTSRSRRADFHPLFATAVGLRARREPPIKRQVIANRTPQKLRCVTGEARQ